MPATRPQPNMTLPSFAALVAAGFLLLSPVAASAQTPEVFLGQGGLWGDPNAKPLGETTENHLAKCLADPSDRVSCHLARENKTDGGLESALQHQLETVIVDYSAGEPVVKRGEPVSFAAPQTPVASQAPQLAMVEANVYFAYDSTAFAPGEEGKVAQLATALKDDATRDLAFLVLGHTDAKGADAYNCRLSRARAEALASALVSQGVPPTRLIAIGVGERILKNAADGLAPENRRVGFAPLGASADVVVSHMRSLCK